jgi:hypothetical protein
VRVIVLVAHENPFASSAHTVHDIVLFETSEACEDGGVFFRLGFLGAESVVGEGVEANCFGLVGIEGVGEKRRIGGLKSGGCYCRHGGCCFSCTG